MHVEIIRNPGSSFDRRYDQVSGEKEGDCIVIHGFKDPGYCPDVLGEAVLMQISKLEEMQG